MITLLCLLKTGTFCKEFPNFTLHIYEKTYTILLVILFAFRLWRKRNLKIIEDSVVQLYGVVMSADSLQGLPAVSVVVKGRNQGTITNDQGVFSIVVLKGDQIEFTSVGYKPKLVTIPKNLEGNQQSIIQLMVQDTVYLAATIIKKYPTKEEFARDFANVKIPDDQEEIARQNMSEANRRASNVSLSCKRP